MGTTCPAGLAGLPVALCHSQRNSKLSNVFAYERLGAPNLLVGLNNDPNNAKTITVATAFGSNVSLHDYTGHSPDVVTDGSGSVTITIPRNQNGASYVCYSRQGAHLLPTGKVLYWGRRTHPGDQTFAS